MKDNLPTLTSERLLGIKSRLGKIAPAPDDGFYRIQQFSISQMKANRAELEAMPSALRELAAQIKAPDYVPACCLRDAANMIERLRAAIETTLEENLHLADGDDCTLKRLKDAVGIE